MALEPQEGSLDALGELRSSIRSDAQTAAVATAVERLIVLSVLMLIVVTVMVVTVVPRTLGSALAPHPDLGVQRADEIHCRASTCDESGLAQTFEEQWACEQSAAGWRRCERQRVGTDEHDAVRLEHAPDLS